MKNLNVGFMFMNKELSASPQRIVGFTSLHRHSGWGALQSPATASQWLSFSLSSAYTSKLVTLPRMKKPQQFLVGAL